MTNELETRAREVCRKLGTVTQGEVVLEGVLVIRDLLAEIKSLEARMLKIHAISKDVSCQL